jgi:hypothetical protein
VIRESHPSQGKEAARPREVQQKDRKVKERAPEKKESSGKKEKKERKEKPAVFTSGKDALKGVPQDEIDKHKKDHADCWRCGRSGHKMYDCYAKKTVGGHELSGGTKTASSAKSKRDNDSDNDEPEQPKGKGKKAKAAAVRPNDEDIDIPDAQPRI